MREITKNQDNLNILDPNEKQQLEDEIKSLKV